MPGCRRVVIVSGNGILHKIKQQLARMNERELEMLSVYAEFLLQRQGKQADTVQDIAVPAPLERSENETVVTAIKRLSAAYPLLDKAKMLQETYTLMCQHTLEGRPAVEVIDDLEALFAQQEALRKQKP